MPRPSGCRGLNCLKEHKSDSKTHPRLKQENEGRCGTNMSTFPSFTTTRPFREAMGANLAEISKDKLRARSKT